MVDCCPADKLGSSDHEVVLCPVLLPTSFLHSNVVKSKLSGRKPVYVWSDSSICKAKRFLLEFDWDSLFNVNNTPQHVWDHFSSTVNFCTINFARLLFVNVEPRVRMPNPLIQRLFILKASLWRKLRGLPHGEDSFRFIHNRYKALAIRINNLLLESRRLHEKEIIGAANTKKFFSFVNSRLRESSRISVLRSGDGSLVCDPLAMAELLNGTFAKAFISDKSLTYLAIPNCNYISPQAPLCTVLFPPSLILSIISKLKNSKRISPDGFSPFIIKLFGSVIRG